ncbi:MAG TPA: putative nucleotidyltransferase substrate binding domain-containing protein [Gammaproteobacteria bacterium]|nr:putative nucleotidyltransferase substrate binding domain-containing protein [Gammaproteobacteria bacterium]
MNAAATLSASRLAATGTFGGLEPEVLQALIAAGEVRRLPAGETVFRAGEDYSGSVFIICAGEAEIRRANGETFREEAGAVLGLSNYLDGAAYRATAAAVSDCELLALDAEALRDLETRYPALFDAMNRLVAERIRGRRAAVHALSGALTRPVRTVMKTPLATTGPGISLREAFALMQARKIGSLGVRGDDGRLLGLLTCSGLSEAALLKGAAATDSVMQAACEEPRTIAAEAPLWEAEDRLQRYGVKYLVVLEGDTPVGMVSQTDILRALSSQYDTVQEQAHDARSVEALHRLYRDMHRVARQARETNRLASRAVRALSDAHLALQRRCVELALGEMAAARRGDPPRAFAVLVMGSGGRREMLLNPDQDNGLLIADGAAELTPEEADWFTDFAQRLNRLLADAGYILCPGDIMARNPMFRRTLSHWREQVSHIARRANQKAARWSNIVFDFDTLYGDEALTHALRDHVLAELGRQPTLLEFMVEDDAEGRPPLGLFNRLIAAGDTQGRGRLDIKRNGLRIVADAARVYALSAGISSCNTNERLQALVRQGVLSAELVGSVSAAYEVLLDLLLGHQLDQAAAGQKPDKLIVLERLSDPQRSSLRAAMVAIKRLQDQLQGRFGREAF